MKKMFIIVAVGLLIYPFLTHRPQKEAVVNAVQTAEDSDIEICDVEIYMGTWSSIKTGVAGKFEVLLKRLENSEVSGSIKIQGSSVTKGGDIKGTIAGDKIEFGLVKDKRGELKYSGTISDNAMEGVWDIPVIKDHGVWQATRT